jgi:predicted GTPase
MTAKNLTQDELKLLNVETQALIQKNGSWHQQILSEIRQAIQSQAKARAARQS